MVLPMVAAARSLRPFHLPESMTASTFRNEVPGNAADGGHDAAAFRREREGKDQAATAFSEPERIMPTLPPTSAAGGNRVLALSRGCLTLSRGCLALAWLLGTMTGSSAGADDAGEKYALLVGVRNYEHDLRSLRFTEQDVVELGEVLRDSGYHRRNVVIMTQQTGALRQSLLPRRENILRELSRLLAKCTERDSVVLALAGHGVQFRNSTDSFFCPMDGRLDDRNSLISINDLYQTLDNSPAHFKLLIVDACRDQVLESSRSRAVVDLESVTRPGEKTPPAGAAAIFSCSPGQQAFENEKFHHGLFFHALIEGLRGAADFDKNSAVTLPELELFVKQKTAELAQKEFGKDQMPDVFNRTRGLVPLVRLDRDRSAWLSILTGRAWKPQLEAWKLPGDSRVMIEGVIRDSNAARSGLRVGDVIEAVNGQPIRDDEQLWELIDSNLPGESATFDVVREGKPVRVAVQWEPRRGEADRARLIRLEAEQGAAWAQNSFGGRLLAGRGVPLDAAQAAEWVRKSADQGDRNAENQLGLLYQAGLGVPRDVREAVKWFRRAAEKGSAYAEYNLARCAAAGRGMPQDDRESARWLRLSAEHGNEWSQDEYGVFLASGRGVTKDEAEAARWYRRAAEQGLDTGAVHLATALRYGRGVPHDDAEAAQWFEKGARKGNATAQYGWGAMLMSGRGVPRNEAEGLRWIRKAAEQGHAAALNSVGIAFASGKGTGRDDAEAVRWYRKAAEKGSSDGQNNLGRMLFDGRGLAKDETEAVAWFRKSADQNNAAAMTNVGLAYSLGRGIGKDDAEALKWWRKAAAAGEQDAQYRAGLAALEGRGMKADRGEALRLLKLAADGGSSPAKKKLQELEKPPAR